MITIKLLRNFIEITLRHGFSPVNFPHIFRTPFTENTSGWLLLDFTVLCYGTKVIDNLEFILLYDYSQFR